MGVCAIASFNACNFTLSGGYAMKSYLALAVMFTAVMLTGCDTGPKSSSGFSLPDGDARYGRAVFETLQCNACHIIDGIEQLGSDDKQGISVKLGGEVSSIKTYGELVTSVINPSHRLAKGYPLEEIQSNGVSKMRNYNDTMTVDQLINLVAFLQSKYELEKYLPSNYPMFDYSLYDDPVDNP